MMSLAAGDLVVIVVAARSASYERESSNIGVL